MSWVYIFGIYTICGWQLLPLSTKKTKRTCRLGHTIHLCTNFTSGSKARQIRGDGTALAHGKIRKDDWGKEIGLWCIHDHRKSLQLCPICSDLWRGVEEDLYYAVVRRKSFVVGYIRDVHKEFSFLRYGTRIGFMEKMIIELARSSEKWWL